MAASPVLANRTFSATIMAHMLTLSPVPSPVGVYVILRFKHRLFCLFGRSSTVFRWCEEPPLCQPPRLAGIEALP